MNNKKKFLNIFCTVLHTYYFYFTDQWSSMYVIIELIYDIRA